MHVFHGLAAAKLDRPSVITIGNFDGVHLGHQHLLAEVVKKSKEFNALAGAVTFDPHPVKVLYPERGLHELLSLEEVLQLLEENHLDFTVVQTFDFAFSRQSPVEFVKMLMPLKPAHIVVGYDFSFGAGRSGDLQMLRELGESGGFTVSQVAPLVAGDQPISSSRIRQNLTDGAIEAANALLGRPFFIRGKVVKGQSRGRRLGFPTANMATSAEIIPRTGVYVTRLWVDGRGFPAVTNIGFNPTFADPALVQKLSVETHMLDEDRDLYGKDVKLEFLARLRDEQKFASAAALVERIQLDVREAKKFFSGK